VGEQDLIKVAKEAVESFNKADWDRSMELLGTGVYNEVGTGRKLRGQAEILPALQGWRKAMPDVRGTVTHAVASGSTAVLEVTWEGTQTGPMDGPGGTLPPSGSARRRLLPGYSSSRVTRSRRAVSTST
jgi:predicted ester cyclase